MIIKIEIVIFKGILNRIDIAILWSKCDSTPIQYRPRETGDRRRRSQNGFYNPVSPIMPTVEEFISPRIDHAKCRGVYIFNSECWGTKIKMESTSNSI